MCTCILVHAFQVGPYIQGNEYSGLRELWGACSLLPTLHGEWGENSGHQVTSKYLYLLSHLASPRGHIFYVLCI